MKIYKQINENDCGISVTQSLIKHFLKKDISKEELYKHANINEEGMSILDLENLNRRYGILLESYEMDFNEFQNHETNQYFLLIVKKGHMQHFVIAKKNKKQVIIYDPEEGKLKFLYGDFRVLYEDIFISIKISKNTNISSERTQENKQIHDLSKICSLLLINLSTFALAMAVSFLIKYWIKNIYDQFNANNIGKILLSIVLMCFLQHFGEYMETCLTIKYKNHYSKSLYQFLLNSLKNKKNSYFGKLGKDQFLLAKTHIDNISYYHAECLNKWLISSLILLFVGFLLFQIHVLFAPVIIVFWTIQFLFQHEFKKTQKKYLSKIIDLQNQEKQLSISLKNFIQHEINKDYLNKILKECGNNHSQEILRAQKILEKNNIFSRINSFINHLLYLSIIGLSTYLIFSSSIGFGHLSIINFFYGQITKSTSSLGEYYSFKERYEYSRKIYDQLVNIDLEKEEPKTIDLPKSIDIKNLFYGTSSKVIFNGLNLQIKPNTLIYGPSGIGKTVLYRLIGQKIICSEDCIFFEKTPISSINPNSLNNLLIYQTSEGYIPKINLLDLVNSLCPEQKNHSINICKLMNIVPENQMNPNQLSSGQKQLLRILDLQRYSNKLLLLDEIASHINLENKIYIFKNIIPHISRKNFLVCSEHCHELMGLFPNSIDLESHVIHTE